MAVASIEKITATTKANVEALAQSGTATVAGLQELAKAYQDMAARNAERLTASFQAVAAIKSPEEFKALQEKLVQEAVDASIADRNRLNELTAAVFAAAFDPIKKQIEVVTQRLDDMQKAAATTAKPKAASKAAPKA